VNRIFGAAKATYNFFSGDAIAIGFVAAAFIAAYLLEAFTQHNQWAAGVTFVVLILLGLTVTLGRERASARRKHLAERRTP
jgi:MFS family permease